MAKKILKTTMQLFNKNSIGSSITSVKLKQTPSTSASKFQDHTKITLTITFQSKSDKSVLFPEKVTTKSLKTALDDLDYTPIITRFKPVTDYSDVEDEGGLTTRIIQNSVPVLSADAVECQIIGQSSIAPCDYDISPDSIMKLSTAG